jgi:NAD(P)-dependent dehydrogenase (short-subunit alcohol dehydrogenase family)
MAERPLAGTSAVVTGGTSGIGRALGVALAAQGVGVFLVGRDAERARTARDELGASGAGHRVVTGDLTKTDFLGALAGEALAWCDGRLALLALCAGHHEPALVEATTEHNFEATIATNLRAPFLLTKALLPALRAARGQIVFVNSSVVNHPRANTAIYAASKAALRAFADCLRWEVGGDGVGVMSVFPGRTATPMQRDRYEREGLEYRPELLLQPEEVAEAVLQALGSGGEVTELHVRPRHRA